MPAAALGFALAAAVACWNPVAAPFGMVVGAAAALIAWRSARRGRGSRRLALVAAAIGAAAAIASAVVLAVSAGSFGPELPGQPIVPPRRREEVRALLDQAEGRTRGARERAARELEEISPSGRDGGSTGRRREAAPSHPGGE